MSLFLNPARETAAEEAIRHYVLHQAAFGIYDPLHPLRPKVEVAAFEMELFEWNDEESIAHAAGPVLLRGPQGEVGQFVRLSLPLVFDGDQCRVGASEGIRAAYIIDLDLPSGACKETAALANA